MILGIALFGLLLGSFLNVVIYRLPLGLSLIRPGSRCPSCQNPIRFYDNIPLLSYFILRGRCRQCRSSIAWRYPLVEALTALCFAALFWKYALSREFLTYTVLVLFLIPISFIDLDKGLILNRLTIPGFILGICMVLGFQVETWDRVLLGALAGGGVVFLIGVLGRLAFRKESLGMGDVKLLIMIGVYVGFPGVVVCLFLGVLAAAVFIVVQFISKKLRLGETIPFGPFIAVGSLVFLLWGEAILAWYVGRF